MNNFGNLKDTFNNILSESVLTKNDEGKKLFTKYVQTLKEDDNLKKEYLIFKNLTHKKFTSEIDAKDYIKENIKLLKNNNPSKGIKKLLTILGKKEITTENREIYNHIEVLRNTHPSATTIDKLQESLNYITKNMLKEEEVVENEFDTVDVPPSVLTKMAVNRFNLKYEDISESEREIIKTVLNGNGEEKEKVYDTLKNECVDTIDKRLEENTDIDLKDKLLRVKDKLLRMSYNEESYPTDIDSIYNLKTSVIE